MASASSVGTNRASETRRHDGDCKPGPSLHWITSVSRTEIHLANQVSAVNVGAENDVETECASRFCEEVLESRLPLASAC